MNIFSISTIILLLFSIGGYAQSCSISVRFKEDQCSLRLKFKNKSNENVLIPDFTIRRIMQNKHAVLSPEHIQRNLDTLEFSLNSKDDSAINRLIIIPTPMKGTDVSMYHADIWLKRVNYQQVRLPEEFCSHYFKYCKIYFDGVLLAEAKVRR